MILISKISPITKRLIYELNKELTIARRNSFKFIQINKLTIKIYSNLFCIKIDY